MRLRNLLLFLALLSPILAFSQSELPTITWPYQFDEFKDGKLCYANTAESNGRFNIHLKDNVLQYINKSDGRVHKVETAGISYLDIDSVHYVVAGGKMMQDLYSQGGVKLLLCQEADWDNLFTYQGAAYGMNITTSAAMATHPFNLAGLDRPLFSTLEAQKHDGRHIIVHPHYYISSGGSLAKANKKAVQDLFHLDSKAFKAFLKENHTDWQSPESLKSIVDYLAHNAANK